MVERVGRVERLPLLRQVAVLFMALEEEVAGGTLLQTAEMGVLPVLTQAVEAVLMDRITLLPLQSGWQAQAEIQRFADSEAGVEEPLLRQVRELKEAPGVPEAEVVEEEALLSTAQRGQEETAGTGKSESLHGSEVYSRGNYVD